MSARAGKRPELGARRQGRHEGEGVGLTVQRGEGQQKEPNRMGLGAWLGRGRVGLGDGGWGLEAGDARKGQGWGTDRRRGFAQGSQQV